MITLYSKDGLTEKAEIKKFTYNGQFLGECSISATITSPSPINFEIGDYCIFRGERFELNYIPAKEKQASANSYGDAFVYDNIKFNSLADELTRVDFIDIVLPDNNIHYTSKPDFSFYASSVKDLADRIQANLNAEFTGDKAWNVVVLPELVTPDRNITVSGLSVWEALALVSSEFSANFIIRNRTITIGTSGYAVGAVFGYGKGNGLYDIQQNTNQDAKIITRLRAYGSMRNLPNRYYNKLKDENNQPYISESAYIPNLMLPGFPAVQDDPKRVYLESNSIEEYGIRYGHVYFDGTDENTEIYPSLEGMTSEQLSDAGIIVSLPNGDNGNIDEVLGADNPTDNGEIPENPESIDGQFTIYLKDLGFDLSEKDNSGNYVYATTDTMQINMRSGMCVGRTFDVISNGITKDISLGYIRFKVICNRFTDDSVDMAYPNSQYHIDSGDKFVLLGISMPDVYIKAASQRLLSAAWEYLSQNDETKYTYTPKIDEIFMARHPEIGEAIKEGDIFNFTDTDLDIDASVIIQNLKITYDLSSKAIPTYDISLSNERIATTIQKMQSAISSLQQNVTDISIDQVKSLIASIGTRYYLSKLYDDTASGNMNFMQNVSIVKDLLVKENVVSKGKMFSNQFGNETFTSGQFGNGFRTWLAANGQSYAEFDNLMVRREMIINTLTIAEIKSVGGQILLSLANMYCNGVTDGGTYWKCTFDTANGTISNQFAVDDQVICRKFNGANIKYYWAKVTSIGSDYINISKSDKDGTGIPAINDEIIQFGNRTNASRQSAIMLSAYGSDAPSIKQYSGINSYNLTGKEVTVISPSGNKFTGDFTIQSSGTNVTTAIDNAKNTAISTAATDATNKVNAIQIGGRNLVRGTTKPYFNQFLWVATGWSGISPLWNDTENAIELTAVNGWQASSIALTQAAANQEDIIISFKVKQKEGHDIVPVYMGVNNSAAWTSTVTFTPTSEWVYYKFTFKATGTRLNITIRGIDGSSKTYKILIQDLMFEKGNKDSTHSDAPEDLQGAITVAQTAATNAATAASNAQTSANTANSLLADIANDNLLIPSEKQDVLKEWQIIQGEYPTVVAQATTYSVSSSDYTAKYNALNTYITPLLSSMTTNSAIVGTTFRSTFKAYYDAKIALLKLVTDKAKTIADQAQTDANTAKSNAQIAQSAAEAAQTTATTAKNTADTANALLTDIASDNKLTPNEKSSVRQEWNVIAAELSVNNTQADTFGITTEKATYNSAFQALANYLNNGTTWSTGVPSWISDTNLSVTTTIVGSTFRANWKAYYDARTILLNAIAKKSKQLADAAQSSADTANAGLLNKVAYSEYNAQMQIQNDKIASRVSQNDFNALGQRVGTTESQITQQSGQISSVVTQVNTAQTTADNASTAASNANTNAQNAQTTANSKNRTYYQDAQPTAPSGGFSIGDIWQKVTLTDISGIINSDTTKNVYRLEYRWNGTTWVQINVNISGSYVTQTNDSITSVVTKTGINGLGVGETLKSLIDQTPGQIELAVSAIQVGGRNLIPNTNKGIVGWSRTVLNGTHSIIGVQALGVGAMKAITSVASSGYNVISKSLNHSLLKNNTQYIISMDIYSEYDTTMLLTLQATNGTNQLAPWYTKVITKDTWIHVVQIINTNSTVIFNQVLYLSGFNQIGGVTIANLKLEEGNKATTWTPAPEDVQANIDNANTAATNAATAASNADTKATTANNLLTDIANDNKLDPAEKQSTKKEWDIIVSEYSKNIAQANSFTVSTAVYTSAYNALSSYITPLLSNLNTTSDIVGTTFRSNFKSYYDARTDLLNAVSTKAKSIADSKTDLDTVKAGITINADGVTAFGNQFKVDSLLIANAIQTNELNVGNGNFKVGTDGKISAKGAALEGSLEIGWDGDTSKPVNRITVVDRSSSTQKTKVLITPQNITSLSSIGGNTTNPLVVSGGAATSRNVYSNSGQNTVTWMGASINLPTGKIYDVEIPAIRLEASAANPSTAGFSMYLDNLTTGESTLTVSRLGQSVVVINQSITIAGLQPGNYRLRIVLEAWSTTSIDISSSSLTIPANAAYTVRPITDAVEIGANGMCGIFTTARYFHVTTDGYYVRYGDTGFRITSTGIQKSSNMTASTPTWTNI